MKSLKPIYIAANTDAVDAGPITKDIALMAVAKRTCTPLECIGAIGDSVNDLPFLRVSNLGLVGAPRNAQPVVRKFVENAPNGYVSERDYLEGFLDFYARCTAKHLQLVVADRDGVLVWNNDEHEIQSLAKLFATMGNDGHPIVFILTGSSAAQNQDLLRKPAIADALAHNKQVRLYPYLILAENGAIALNVLDGSANLASDSGANETSLLTSEFRTRLLEKVDREVLPKFDLAISYQHADQDGKIFIPEKRTMVTLNIPRSHKEFRDYRRSADSGELRAAISKAMVDTADQLSIPYCILEESSS